MSIVVTKEIGGNTIVEDIKVYAGVLTGSTSFPGYGDYVPGTVNDTLIELIDRKADISTAIPSGGISTDFLAGDRTWKPVTKSTVGLPNADNTSDLNKPISTATQAALNAKEPTIASGNSSYFFAGDKTWKPVTKNIIGLDQVTNDTQLKLIDLDTDSTFTANSDSKIPSQKAVKTALDLKQDDLVSGTHVKTINSNSIVGSGNLNVSLPQKSGVVASGSFTGNPKKATVAFSTAFADANYSISIIGIDSMSWSIETVVAGSFVINSNANTAPTGNVYWTATKHGEI